MIGQRTRHSFAQFLELQEPMISTVLLGKYSAQHLSLSHGQLLCGLLNALRDLDDRTLMLALAEVVATAGDLRTRVNPVSYTHLDVYKRQPCGSMVCRASVYKSALNLLIEWADARMVRGETAAQRRSP